MTLRPYPFRLTLCFLLTALLWSCGPDGNTRDHTLPQDSMASTQDTIAVGSDDGALDVRATGYFEDSLSEPRAWVNESYLLVKDGLDLDTFLLDEGAFHKSLRPSLSTLQLNGAGRLEIVVTSEIWNSSRGVDVESGDYLYGWEESCTLVEIFDVDAGKRVFHFSPEFEYWQEETQGGKAVQTDSTQYSYDYRFEGASLVVSPSKGFSAPDLKEGRYLWKGTEFVLVKL